MAVNQNYAAGAAARKWVAPPTADYSGYGGNRSGGGQAGGAADAAQAQAGDGGGGAGGTGGGRGYGNAALSARFGGSYNPQYRSSRYAGQMGQIAGNAAALGTRNYGAEMRGLANEDVNRQQTAADNQLGALGMRELALRTDVQADRTKQRQDAEIRASIEAENMQRAGLSTATDITGAAEGLDRGVWSDNQSERQFGYNVEAQLKDYGLKVATLTGVDLDKAVRALQGGTIPSAPPVRRTIAPPPVRQAIQRNPRFTATKRPLMGNTTPDQRKMGGVQGGTWGGLWKGSVA